jgi:hypothetical protein
MWPGIRERTMAAFPLTLDYEPGEQADSGPWCYVEVERPGGCLCSPQPEPFKPDHDRLALRVRPHGARQADLVCDTDELGE